MGFEALNRFRRIIINHAELLNFAVVKSVIPDIMKHAESLRSSLSKNAVLVINELSNRSKKLLDSEVEMIFRKLLKKTLDSSSFIAEEVRKALISICSNCS